MNHIYNIIRKELKELLTVGSVLSVLVMVVLFAGLGGLIGGEVDKAQATPVFGIANSENGHVDGTIDGIELNWDAKDILVQSYAKIVGEENVGDYIIDLGNITQDQMIDAMNDKGITSAIYIDGNFSTNILEKHQGSILEYYIYEPSGMFGSVSSTVLSSIVSGLNNSLSMTILEKKLGSSDYQFCVTPIDSGGNNINTIVNGSAHSNVTPYEISNGISSKTMMIPIIIMIIIMMVGSIVISSMGSEKENKTLETLLTLPIKRTTIVTGKIIAAAIVGLVYGLAYMAGMSIYMGALMDTTSTGINLDDLGLSLGITDYALIMVSMFLSIICALGICMILGAFAKNYKSAQTMTMPLSILAMIPMFVIMFSGWYGSGLGIQAILFAIPFSHPMISMQALMYNDFTLVFSGIAYMFVFAVVTIIITVKLYGSDILVTGLGQNKLYQKLTNKK